MTCREDDYFKNNTIIVGSSTQSGNKLFVYYNYFSIPLLAARL